MREKKGVVGCRQLIKEFFSTFLSQQIFHEYLRAVRHAHQYRRDCATCERHTNRGKIALRTQTQQTRGYPILLFYFNT